MEQDIRLDRKNKIISEENASSPLSSDEKCTLCPVKCGTNRRVKAGACGVQGIHVAKYYLHPYEEPCISYAFGSGTIFFTGCNLRCAFCQNFEVSRAKRGKSLSPSQLADVFKELEDRGADNISLVTPSHLIDGIEQAFKIYRPKIPVVYNSSGYDDVESLKKIDEYVDVYLPDLKFYSPYLSKRYTGREDYFSVASKAILFMSKKPVRFSDPLDPNEISAKTRADDTVRKASDDAYTGGKMLSGLIVRHLVMPLCVNDSLAILKWCKNELPPQTYLSLMSQYTPFGEIEKFPELSRPVTAREYDAVVDAAFSLGFKNLFMQKRDSSGTQYVPQWDF